MQKFVICIQCLSVGKMGGVGSHWWVKKQQKNKTKSKMF